MSAVPYTRDENTRQVLYPATSVSAKVIALAGNPNVGKSTVFNALTGLRQHTGNWPGKTVCSAQGRYMYKESEYLLVDLPGTYSLIAHSAEEEVARDFILYGGMDAVVVVCDATCLERNLNLVLQTIEITSRVVVCVNLMDEAKKKSIGVNLKKLEELLGVPVVGASARGNRGLDELVDAAAIMTDSTTQSRGCLVYYPEPMEQAIAIVEPVVARLLGDAQPEGTPMYRGIRSRWLALRLITNDDSLYEGLERHMGFDISENREVAQARHNAHVLLAQAGMDLSSIRDRSVLSIIQKAEQIANDTVTRPDSGYDKHDRNLDKILTSKSTGIPIMILLLWVVFWITLSGANIPSQFLADGLFWVQDRLSELFFALGVLDWLHGLLVLGVFRVLAWVVSVMLPPMALFFPLFTLLEDFGYLPRIAFNLDHQFKKACACGKQALTMCMGFGCNAAGIVGCRIIDSPRERLIAVLTNNFVPCNGRLPPYQLE